MIGIVLPAASLALLLSLFVSAHCFGFVPWHPGRIYVAGWRRWLIARGIAWSESGFPRWAKAAWWLGRLASFGNLHAGLAWSATDAMMMGVGDQTRKAPRIRKGDAVFVEVLKDDVWHAEHGCVVELLEGPLGPSAVVQFASGGHRGAKGTRYAESDKHDLLPVSCLGVS